MAGQLKIGGNVIATHSGSEGAGTVTLDSSTLTIGSNTTIQGTMNAGSIGTSVTGLTGLKVVDTWNLTTSFTGVADPITSNLARATDTRRVGFGSAMTESSGIFTFPMTGYYLIEFHTNHSLNGDMQHGATYINSVISGTASIMARNYIFVKKHNGTTYTNHTVSCTFDCIDTSTHKVSFSCADMSNTGLNTNASATLEYTTMRFIRLGDT